MNEPLYRINQLSFKFRKRDDSYSMGRLFSRWRNKKDQTPKDVESFILGPINMSISKGKLTAILGKSGSGKSTLFSILGLLRKQDSGEIDININEEISTGSLWKNTRLIEQFRATHLGYALQRGELLPYLTVYENAKLVSEFIQIDDIVLKERIDTEFEHLFVGEKPSTIYTLKKSLPQEVSQGQYQRGAILRALANDPSIILADEPTGNLDQEKGKKVMQIFKNIVDSKTKSVLVITHDLHLAASYADEIFVLEAGKIKSQYVIDDKLIELNQNSRSSRDSIAPSYPMKYFLNSNEGRKELRNELNSVLDSSE